MPRRGAEFRRGVHPRSILPLAFFAAAAAAAALCLCFLVETAGASGVPATTGDEFLDAAIRHEHSGIELANQAKWEEALEEFQAAIGKLSSPAKRKKAHKSSLGRLELFVGNVHTLLGDLPKGLDHWKRAMKHDSALQDASNNVIKTLTDQGNYKEALKYARKAARARPRQASAHIAVGDACKMLRNFTCAEEHFEKAVGLEPGGHNSLFALATMHRDLGALPTALGWFEKAQAADPDSLAVLNALAVVRGDMCLWRAPENDFSVEGEANRLLSVALDSAKNGPSAVHPLLLAYHLDDPLALKTVVNSIALSVAKDTAVTMGKETINQASSLPFPSGGIRGLFPRDTVLKLAAKNRLRVAYLTADAHDHPTALLVRGMWREQKLAGKVEAFVFSYGPDDGSVYRKAIQKEVEHFRDMQGKTFREIATEVNKVDAHILIDMKQHTESHAISVLTMRPAEVQVAWLGFPGGVGGGLVDFLVSDRTVTPPEHKNFFEERLALMPMRFSYQRNGLSSDPFVGGGLNVGGGGGGGSKLMCLNHPRKVKRQRFESWMGVMRELPGSTLSILARHNGTESNLRREAESLGIDGSRITEVPVVDKAKHVARFRAADVFLDTFPYSAHTTCTEALYAGLPVVTRPGQTFASRVCASLLAAMGLDSLLVAPTEDVYISVAAAVARSKGSVRKVVEDKAATDGGIFDKEGGWVRGLDVMLRMMWETRRKTRGGVVVA